MLISAAFPSNYIKAADLQNQNVMVVIERIQIEDVGDETKPVLYFQNKAKGMVLNKTNANNIALVYGDETDDWLGKELVLYPTMVDFQGRSVPAIRVRVPAPRERTSGRAAAADAAPRYGERAVVQATHGLPNAVSPRIHNGAHSQQPVRHDLDDEIPF